MPVTETAFLNKPKNLQLEAGILYEKLDDASKNFSLPAITIHYSLNDRFELFLSNSFNFNIDDEASNNNFPLTLGLKTPIIKKENTTFSIATYAIGNIEKDKKITVNPSAYLLFSHQFNSKILVEANFGQEYDFFGNNFISYYSTVITSASHPKLHPFIEIYGNFSIEDHPHHHLNAGLIYAFNNKIQIIGSSGCGLNSNSAKYFAYIGV